MQYAYKIELHIFVVDFESLFFFVIIFNSLPELQRKKDSVKQPVTEEMLDEVVHVCLSETDNISLLDIPNTLVSANVDDAEAIK